MKKILVLFLFLILLCPQGAFAKKKEAVKKDEAKETGAKETGAKAKKAKHKKTTYYEDEELES